MIKSQKLLWLFIKLNFSTFILLIIIITTSCDSSKRSFFKEQEKFSEFNTKFHKDSAFQLSRIDFPIKGYFIKDEEQKRWTENNWIIHKTPLGETKENGYEVEVIKKSDLVIEKIWIENSEFYIERRFKLIEGKWYLVYFKDIN